MCHYCIWLLPLWWREVLRGRALWPSPVSLAHEKGTPHCSRIEISSSFVYQILLYLYNTTSLTFVIYTKNLPAYFKSLASGGRRKRLVKGQEALTINEPTRVEFRNPRNWIRNLGCIEVDYFLRGLFEC